MAKIIRAGVVVATSLILTKAFTAPASAYIFPPPPYVCTGIIAGDPVPPGGDPYPDPIWLEPGSCTESRRRDEAQYTFNVEQDGEEWTFTHHPYYALCDHSYTMAMRFTLYKGTEVPADPCDPATLVATKPMGWRWQKKLAKGTYTLVVSSRESDLDESGYYRLGIIPPPGRQYTGACWPSFWWPLWGDDDIKVERVKTLYDTQATGVSSAIPTPVNPSFSNLIEAYVQVLSAAHQPDSFLRIGWIRVKGGRDLFDSYPWSVPMPCHDYQRPADLKFKYCTFVEWTAESGVQNTRILDMGPDRGDPGPAERSITVLREGVTPWYRIVDHDVGPDSDEWHPYQYLDGYDRDLSGGQPLGMVHLPGPVSRLGTGVQGSWADSVFFHQPHNNNLYAKGTTPTNLSDWLSYCPTSSIDGPFMEVIDHWSSGCNASWWGRDWFTDVNAVGP